MARGLRDVSAKKWAKKASAEVWKWQLIGGVASYSTREKGFDNDTAPTATEKCDLQIGEQVNNFLFSINGKNFST